MHVGLEQVGMLRTKASLAQQQAARSLASVERDVVAFVQQVRQGKPGHRQMYRYSLAQILLPFTTTRDSFFTAQPPVSVEYRDSLHE